MAPHSNPDPPPSGSEPSPDDSPSADDLLALIPDMELLETSTVNARAAHSAGAATGSGRKPGATPTLTDPRPATAVRSQPSNPVISDDPYADLMPEPEALQETIPVARAVPPLPTPGRAPTPPVNARKPPHPVAVPPVMDRDFIARNRIVELYLAGSLPVRGATVFERFCRENPQILDEIGLPERVHAGLRLLEASGKPEPWQEKPKKLWERPQLPIVLASLIVLLGIGLLVLNSRLSDQRRQVAALHKLVVEQPLDAAASTSSIEIQPTHAGPSAAIAAVVGGATAQLVNIRIDMTHSDFRAFRVTIDRVDQGRVAVLNNLIKDSNGALGLSLNTSALGPGNYLLTIEGLDWRGDPQPDSWAALSIRH